MTVIHVIWHLGIGGGELFLRDLVLALAQRGTDQQVWTVGPAGPVARDVIAGEVPIRSYNKSSKVGLNVIRTMARDLRCQRPSLVHTHGEAGLVWGLPAARLAGVPAVSLMYINDEETPAKMWTYRRLLRWPSSVIAGSESVGRFLASRLGVAASRMRVVPCGITLDAVSAPADRARPAAPVIVSVGRLVERKGHHVLIDAFAAVLRHTPHARLQVVGDGPRREYLRRQAQDLGIADRVHFAGTCYPVAPVLADADLFVFPSLEEPQGLAILEAMACGVPIVASRTGGIVEMIEHEANGLLVHPGDADALAAAIIHMLDTPDLGRRYAAQARRRLPAFDVRAIADEYLRIYRDATHGDPHGAAS